MADERLTKDKITQSFKKHNIFHKIWNGIKQFISWLIKIWGKIHLQSKFKKGAAWGAILTTTLLAVAIGIFFRPGIWRLIDVPVGILMVLFSTFMIALSIGAVFGIIYGIITIISWKGFMAMGALIVLLILLNTPFSISLMFGIIIVFIEALLGGLIVYCFTSEFKFGTWLKKGVVLLGIMIILTANILFVKWILNPGNDSAYILLKNSNRIKSKAPVQKVIDPSRTGPFHVIKMTYGSGENKIRPEFGRETDLKSKTVDVRPFLKANSRWKQKLRKIYWTFNFDAFPLNGTVWLPSGKGPYPLILLVHGNYRMEWPSDQGLSYLGKLLASRGFICVSIDENFFNFSWFGGLKKDVDGRAWMILQHIKKWEDWNETEGNPFFNKIDMNNIGLLGHDIGAEAIALASLYNLISRYPGDAKVEFDFNFNIKSLAAIAPCSGRNNTSSQLYSLQNQNLLCIHGVQDSLSSGHWGRKLYDGVSYKGENYWFKSFVYTYRLNHRQFNSEWSTSDYDFPYNLLLNRKLFLKRTEQQKICGFFVSAFFEATLKGTKNYIDIFRNPGSYEKWLPDDYYVSRFEDSKCYHLCTFEEDFEATTGTTDGLAIIGENLKIWQETNNQFLGCTAEQNKCVIIGWEHSKDKIKPIPRYTLKIFLENDFSSNDLSDLALEFSIADGTELFLPNTQSGKDFFLVNFSIEISTSQNQKAKISANKHFTIPIPLKRQITKLGFIEKTLFKKDYRILLQTVQLPLSLFFSDVSKMKIEEISSISFIFDQTARGVILLDDIGFSKIQKTEDPNP